MVGAKIGRDLILSHQDESPIDGAIGITFLTVLFDEHTSNSTEILHDLISRIKMTVRSILAF